MLTGAMWVDSTSAPAALSRPTMVSISGSPAATRLPKAMTSTIIVTGQDSTSDLIMAAWLTLLKFAHSALEPVRLTETVPVDSWVIGARQRVSGADHVVRVRLRAGLDDRGLPVSGDAHTGLRGDDGRDPRVGLQQRGRFRDDLLGGRVGWRSGRRCRGRRPAARWSSGRRSPS